MQKLSIIFSFLTLLKADSFNSVNKFSNMKILCLTINCYGFKNSENIVKIILCLGQYKWKVREKVFAVLWFDIILLLMDDVSEKFDSGLRGRLRISVYFGRNRTAQTWKTARNGYDNVVHLYRSCFHRLFKVYKMEILFMALTVSDIERHLIY